MKYRISDKFTLTDDAIDNYGEEYRGRVFEIDGVYHNHKEHQGYDMGVYPMQLVEAIDFNYAVYEWEIERL